jgi:hypothetical protein
VGGQLVLRKGSSRTARCVGCCAKGRFDACLSVSIPFDVPKPASGVEFEIFSVSAQSMEGSMHRQVSSL